MRGSDVNDPRYKLKPGLYDAGEAAVGIKHLALVKKPDAFQLGTNDPKRSENRARRSRRWAWAAAWARCRLNSRL